jgi:transposase
MNYPLNQPQLCLILMPRTQLRRDPQINVDQLDLENKTADERIALALAAILKEGFRPSRRLIYSFRAAAKTFKIPKTTLVYWFNGRQTQEEAHKKDRRLTPAQEDVLAEWIKEKGRRNVPLNLGAAAQHAKAISGVDIGESWVRRFRVRRKDLKANWTTGLEKCRAQALNPKTTADFYQVFHELVTTYNIKPQNIYNPDEKGAQMGVGKSIQALVDRDQASAKVVEDGNRELVTIIEYVCADGTSLPPNIIFKGTRRDLEWGQVNPCNAR